MLALEVIRELERHRGKKQYMYNRKEGVVVCSFATRLHGEEMAFAGAVPITGNVGPSILDYQTASAKADSRMFDYVEKMFNLHG